VKELSAFRGDIRKHLENLPADLKSAYDQIYDQIRRSPKIKKIVADRAFQWVSYSCLPLSPAELVAAVCQDPDSDAIDPIEIDIEFVLAACRNLLVIDENPTAFDEDPSTDERVRRICRTAHLSVREYFETEHWIRGRIHVQAAKICLKMLNDSSHWNKNFLDLPSDRKDMLEYASDHWQKHLQQCNEENVDTRLVALLKEFLGSINESGPAYRSAYEELVSCGYMSLRPYSRSCFATVAFGLDRFVPDWWEPGFDDVNEINESGDTLLAVAAAHNQLSTARRLMEKGADINMESGYLSRTALGAAAYGGRREMVELLLNNGANVNSKQREYGSALAAAAAIGNTEIVELLLDRGADINMKGKYGSPLDSAAHRRQWEVLKLLLDRGADINAVGGYYGSTLQAASTTGDTEMVELLLDQGADVNLEGGEHGSALAAAAHRGDIETVKILLGRGANINIRGKHGPPINVAADSEHWEVVELLMDRGADINVTEPGYRNISLLGAALGGHDLRGKGSSMAKLLLEKGADPNSLAGAYHGSALGAAATKGNRELVELFLSKGADVNIKGGRFGTPLVAAVAPYWDNREIVGLLLDNGADVNIPGGQYGSALGAATYWGKSEIVQLLLERGADVHIRGGEYGSLLQIAASKFGEREIMELLIDKGADVNIPGGKYGCALGAAAYLRENGDRGTTSRERRRSQHPRRRIWKCPESSQRRISGGINGKKRYN
jgi:ankyrin repeat protein